MRTRRWRRLAWQAARAAAGTAAALFAVAAYVWVTAADVRPLRRTHPDQTSFMRLRAVEAARDGTSPRIRHEWVPLSRIAPVLQRAVVVSEDAAFWGHTGVDMYEVQEALRGWREGRGFRGASTITQQLAKNLYLTPSRNPTRKLAELFIARRLEAELSKRRILELYLNLVEWGDGIWGAEAASQAYFGVPASALLPSEAALLAGALINPRLYNPGAPNRRLRERQRIILRRM